MIDSETLRSAIYFISLILILRITAITATYKIDDSQLGRIFEGIGGLSGGGVYF